jgi:hypothetical protein
VVGEEIKVIEKMLLHWFLPHYENTNAICPYNSQPIQEHQ